MYSPPFGAEQYKQGEGSKSLLHGFVLKTSDPEEAACLLREAAIPYTYDLAPNTAQFSTEIFVAEGQRVMLSRAVTRGAMRVKAALPQDAIGLVIDLRNGVGAHRVNGTEMTVNSECSLVQSPGQPVDVQTPPAFEVLFLRFRHDVVAAELQKMLDREIGAEIAFAPKFRMQTVAGRRLRQLANDLRRTIYTTNQKDVPASLPLRNVEDNLIRLLLEAQPHNYTRMLNHVTAGDAWQIRAAEEFMRANAHLPVSLGDVCAAAGTSVRTLQHMFQKKRGHCPMELLRKIRMENVRKALLQPDEQTSVAREASHWGFLHFGRFARDYRVRFGELPSETLRRARSASAVAVG